MNFIIFLRLPLLSFTFFLTVLTSQAVAQLEASSQTSSETTSEKVQSQQQVERIEVTGSHIKRVDLEGSQPIQTLDQKYFEQTGYNSVGDILRDLTSNSFGSFREVSGSNTAGVAHISLRGLGADRTLVLMNGNRLAKDGISSAPDLNLIPLAAIDRVEILKDSSSATYGSDAVGGVVNVITKKDFVGTEFFASQSVTELKGGEKTTIGGTFGWANRQTNIIASLQYRENKKIFTRDREWTKDGFSPHSPWANVNTNGQGDKALPHCPPQNLDSASGKCFFNWADYATDLPGVKQLNLLSNLEHKINNTMEVAVQFSGTHKETNWQYAPGAVFLKGLKSPFIDDLNLPEHTAGDPINVRWRSLLFGPRIHKIKTNAFGLNTSLKHYLGDSWEVALSVGTEDIKRDDRAFTGYTRAAELRSAIESGDCNIFEANGTCHTGGSIGYTPYEITKSVLHYAEVRGSGEVSELPQGPVYMAVGAQVTYETFSDDYDDLSLAGGVSGGGSGSKGAGHRGVQALFTEFSLPIIEGLELNLAGRYDRYSDFGNTFNPKASLAYKPSQKLLLRASASTGFKAPNMTDLYKVKSETDPIFVDKVACHNNVPNECSPQEHHVIFKGNKNLQEERSRSFNVGAVYQASKNLSLGLDFFDIHLANMVGLDFEALTEAELGNVDLSRYSTTVVRTGDGSIEEITTQFQNLSETHLQGIDLQLEFGYFFPTIGNFAFRNNLGYLFQYEGQGFPGVGSKSILHKNGKPQWRNHLSLEYGPNDSMNFILAFNTIGSHLKQVESAGKLSPYTNVDAQVNYFLKPYNGRITFGIKNLLGQEPPRDESNQNIQVSSLLYESIGRQFLLSYTHTL